MDIDSDSMPGVSTIVLKSFARHTLISVSIEDTRDWGRRLGRCIQSPLVIALYGDLGSGKTVFVQGLADGLEVPAPHYVTSPTYTLINEYVGRLPLHHVDLYRLENPDDWADIGLPDILGGDGVVAIEWADRLAGDLPPDYLRVQLSFITSESRTLSLEGIGDNASRLVRDLKAVPGSRHPD
jgi:tRNA threonylcarbamoyladenosine biosynthesis protein TsaE